MFSCLFFFPVAMQCILFDGSMVSMVYTRIGSCDLGDDLAAAFPVRNGPDKQKKT